MPTSVSQGHLGQVAQDHVQLSFEDFVSFIFLLPGKELEKNPQGVPSLTVLLFELVQVSQGCLVCAQL